MVTWFKKCPVKWLKFVVCGVVLMLLCRAYSITFRFCGYHAHAVATEPVKLQNAHAAGNVATEKLSRYSCNYFHRQHWCFLEEYQSVGDHFSPFSVGKLNCGMTSGIHREDQWRFDLCWCELYNLNFFPVTILCRFYGQLCFLLNRHYVYEKVLL